MMTEVFYWTGVVVFVCGGLFVLCGLVTVTCNELWCATKKAYTMGELQVAMRRHGMFARMAEEKRRKEESE